MRTEPLAPTKYENGSLPFADRIVASVSRQVTFATARSPVPQANSIRSSPTSNTHRQPCNVGLPTTHSTTTEKTVLLGPFSPTITLDHRLTSRPVSMPVW